MTRVPPAAQFANPVWHALHSTHRHLAIGHGDACRYPAAVAPFAAVAAPTAAALRQLHALLAVDESVWLVGPQPAVPELVHLGTLHCLQMVLPLDAALPATPAARIAVTPLSAANAGEMVALTNLAFPGFFRPRTPEMGAYFGVRSRGELVAMGGERLMLDGHPEVSGICTHPDHRGLGLAAGIVGHLLRRHREADLVSWLQVSAENARAIDLYRRLGFEPLQPVEMHRVARAA